MQAFLSALLFPPGINILLLILGFIIHHWWKWTGRLMMVTGIVSLYLFSTLAIGDRMLFNLQKYPVFNQATFLKNHLEEHTAIVVLGGGRRRLAPEYDKEDIVNPMTLERLRYAVILSKRYKLPLLLSGGEPDHEATPEAVLMNQFVVEELHQAVPYLEAHSKNTRQSANNTVAIVKQHAINNIILVTHAWHMKRAYAYFEATGIKVYAAPMGFIPRKPYFSNKIKAFYPTATGLLHSQLALSEYIAYWWDLPEKPVKKELNSPNHQEQKSPKTVPEQQHSAEKTP